MKLRYIVGLSISILLLLSACKTTTPDSEFVKTVDLPALDTFSFRHTLVAGMDFRYSEEHLLEELSEQTLISEMQTRGYEQAGDDGDFFVVVKWTKAVSSVPSPFDHIDGIGSYSNRRDNPTHSFNSRLHVTVEIYDSSSGDLYWRNELPNIFDAIQLTERRIIESLKLAVANFPSRDT